jgi:hypothetical protein
MPIGFDFVGWSARLTVIDTVYQFDDIRLCSFSDFRTKC